MVKAKLESGFTLIELLVVITIIGLMASIALAGLNRARISARDTKRIADIQQVQKALALYLLNNNAYPPIENEGSCGGWDTASIDGDGDGKFWIEGLEDTGIIRKMPRDPIGNGVCNGSYTYFYYVYTGGTYAGCPRNFYVIAIGDLEGTSGAHPSSPGWSCGVARNWQSEFEWVAGAVEQ
jgi:prepilin-type N-terminal cleavage/methylation domain-containing protein